MIYDQMAFNSGAAIITRWTKEWHLSFRVCRASNCVHPHHYEYAFGFYKPLKMVTAFHRLDSVPYKGFLFIGHIGKHV